MHSTILAVALLAAPLAAQAISLEFTPNPAAPGMPVTITGTNASASTVVLSSPCGWLSIHQGSQQGPVVGPNLICIQILRNVAPGGTFNVSWNLRDPNNVPVPPGEYWVETRVWDANFTAIMTNWFCITVLQPGVPLLTAGGLATRGQSTPLQINASVHANGYWFCALSLDSNNPVSVLGLNTCLSVPITGAVFTNAFGQLDGLGNSTGIALNVPNLAFIQHWGLQVQALLVSNAGLGLTNSQSFTVR